MMVTLEALKKFGLAPENTRVVIQGFGNVGGMAAKLMAARGFKIIALIEYDGALHNPAGLDIAALTASGKTPAQSSASPAAVPSTRREAMFLDCDVLVPAATENVITSENAHRLRCKILCEGANGPTTAIADEILADEKDLRHPGHPGQCRRRDSLILRMGAGPRRVFWNEDLVNSRLEEIMVGSFDAVVAYAEKHKVDNRTAAYMLALDRVAIAIKLRGIYA